MPAQSVAELIGNAVRLRQITKAQANALLRHRKHHTEGHMLHMLQLNQRRFLIIPLRSTNLIKHFVVIIRAIVQLIS